MKLRARHVISGLLLAAAGPLAAVDFAAERDERFMQACMSDATVAAGQRQGLCRCLRAEFAYGGRTSFGLTDVLALDARFWEAPDRRLPHDSLGREIRRLRQACLKGAAGVQPPVQKATAQ